MDHPYSASYSPAPGRLHNLEALRSDLNLYHSDREPYLWSYLFTKPTSHKPAKFRPRKVVKSSQSLQSPPSDDELEGHRKAAVVAGIDSHGRGMLDLEILLHGSFDYPHGEDDEDEEEDDDDELDLGARAARLPTPPSPTSTIHSDTLGFPPLYPRAPFVFHSIKPPKPRGTKRCRALLDVSGPNTANLAVKKRRLRSNLITSRLSQPFSHPATHILNREGMKSGNKRFLKSATAVDPQRRASVHTASVLRYALVNRLRKRLGLERPGTAVKSGAVSEEPTGRAEKRVDVGSKTMWTPQSLQSLQVMSGGKYIQPGGDDTHAARTNQHQPNHPEATLDDQPDDVRQSSSTARAHMEDDQDDQDNENDDDLLAYRYLDEDSSENPADDSGDVYSDFSLIFRAKSPSEPQSPEKHSEFEEYLDELDGISWVR